jgi:hypothetical protein
MKLTDIIIASGVAITVTLLATSCVKDRGKEVATEDYAFTNKAFVQVFNGTVGSTRNYVYVDAAPVTGAPLAYGTTFPATPADFALTSGFRSFLIRDTLSTSTQVPMSFAETLQGAANYTIFMYDTTTTAKQKIVTNAIQIPDDTTARLRFANFIYNPTDIGAFDIFSLKRNANVFTNVSVTDVTSFIPYASSLTDTFYIRAAGTTTNLQNKNSTTGLFTDIIGILNPVRKRSYTLIFRGSYRANISNAATVRGLSAFANN